MSRAKKKKCASMGWSVGHSAYICDDCHQMITALDFDLGRLPICRLQPKKPKPARVWKVEDGWPVTPRGKFVEWVCLIKELNRLERKIARLEGR